MLAIYHPLSELPGRSRTWASASEELEINMTAYISNPRPREYISPPSTNDLVHIENSR